MIFLFSVPHFFDTVVHSLLSAATFQTHAAAGKKAGNINMYDAYGQEEVSGRGASGGKLLADTDDYDFM